jgi:hypothetical protein
MNDDNTDERGIRIGGDTMTADADTNALLDVARSVLPGEWTISDTDTAAVRLVGTSDDGWTIEIELHGSTWEARAYADGEDTATMEVTYAASWEATQAERLRKVCELERDRIRKVFDGASDSARALLDALDGGDDD